MADVETVEDYGDDDAGGVARWQAEIKAYNKSFDGWKKRSEKCVKRFRDEREDSDSGSRFNVFWSNIQTQQPALYSRTPQPYITRKNKDRDPIGLAAAEILERTTENGLQDYDFDEEIKAARDDYLLTARGQVWVRYVPYYGEEKTERVPLQYGEDGQVYRENEVVEDFLEDYEGVYIEETYKPVVDEEVIPEYINWQDFGHTPAPTWKKVRAVWKRELLTRDQLVERFGEEIGEKVQLTKTIEGATEEQAKSFPDVFKRAEVFEIWDKTSRQALWISSGYSEGYLDKLDDPLGLSEFFPCPRPMYGTKTGESLIPIPDYYQYQDQARQIDRITARITALTDQLKLVGCYAGTRDTELESMLSKGDGTLVPVANWAAFAEEGGLSNAISWLPIEQVANVLTGLVELREKLKQDMYEITGMSDLLRGVSDPGETYGAQRIKGVFGSMRLQDKQREVQRFVRDVLAIMSEIVAEHFSASTIQMMSGWENTTQARMLEKAQPGAAAAVFERAVELLKNDKLRTFRIAIETDSTVIEDAQQEKAARVDFMQAFAQLLAQAIPAGQGNPALAKPLMETVMFTVRGFNAGRQLETAWESAFEEMTEAGPQQAEDPAAAEKRAEAEIKQLEANLTREKLQAEMAQTQRESEMQVQEHQFKMREIQAKFTATMAELDQRERMQGSKEAHDTRQAALAAQAAFAAQGAINEATALDNLPR